MKNDLIEKKGDGSIINIIVSTGGKEEGVTGFDSWRKRLIVRIKEKPVDGKANRAIRKLFSKIFEVPLQDVSIITGLKASLKTVLIDETPEVLNPLLEEYFGKRLISDD